MATKILSLNLFNLIKSENLKGVQIPVLARKFGICQNDIIREFRKQGILWFYDTPKSVPHNARQIPMEVVDAYLAGESIKCISDRINLARKSLTIKLSRMGIKIRDGSEANIIRFAHATLEEKRQIVSKANAAARGRKRSTDERVKGAITSQFNGNHIGLGEDFFADELSKAGITHIRQAAIDTYNVDFLACDRIAIEIHSGQRLSRITTEYERERVKKLRERGIQIVYVMFSDIDIFRETSDQIISWLKEICFNESSRGKDWMIRCYWKQSIARDNGQKFTSKGSFKYPFCTVNQWNID
jgi:very-short-patch-repair endonuclease